MDQQETDLLFVFRTLTEVLGSPIIEACPFENKDSMMSLLHSFYCWGWVFIVLMVCAGSSEIAMGQWASAFAESALHVSKTVGDLAGPCGFAVCMGISRLLYGKFGEKVDLTIFMVASGVMFLRKQQIICRQGF